MNYIITLHMNELGQKVVGAPTRTFTFDYNGELLDAQHPEVLKFVARAFPAPNLIDTFECSVDYSSMDVNQIMAVYVPGRSGGCTHILLGYVSQVDNPGTTRGRIHVNLVGVTSEDRDMLCLSYNNEMIFGRNGAEIGRANGANKAYVRLPNLEQAEKYTQIRNRTAMKNAIIDMMFSSELREYIGNPEDYFNKKMDNVKLLKIIEVLNS